MHRAGTAGSPYIGPHRGDLLSNLVPFSRGAGQSPMDPLEDGFGMVLIPASSVTSTVSRLGRDDIGYGGPFEAPLLNDHDRQGQQRSHRDVEHSPPVPVVEETLDGGAEREPEEAAR